MLSVIIATRDRAAFLARALDSLTAQHNPPAFEIIVADNGSRDETASVIAERAATGAVRRVYVAEPNRGAARNAGVAVARGEVIVFVDDDVVAPPGFLAAHARAHTGVFPVAASGPILNVPSCDARPAPRAANYSRAFFCTCNVSVPRSALLAAGGFDADFNLYGWEDTELGLRLRRRDVRRAFVWEAFLWHVKPPQSETLEVLQNKVVERGRMAAKLLRKDAGLRTKLATGAYRANLWRAALLVPPWSLPRYEALARNERLPAAVRAFGRAQFLDGSYTLALRGALAQRS